jgi:hypothetical protein
MKLTVRRARAISGEMRSCKLSRPSAGTLLLLLLLLLVLRANSGPRLPGRPDRSDALVAAELLLLLLLVFAAAAAAAAAACRGTSQGAADGGGLTVPWACSR